MGYRSYEKSLSLVTGLVFVTKLSCDIKRRDEKRYQETKQEKSTSFCRPFKVLLFTLKWRFDAAMSLSVRMRLSLPPKFT